MMRFHIACKMWLIAFFTFAVLAGCGGITSLSSDVSIENKGPAEIYQLGELELEKNKNEKDDAPKRIQYCTLVDRRTLLTRRDSPTQRPDTRHDSDTHTRLRGAKNTARRHV